MTKEFGVLLALNLLLALLIPNEVYALEAKCRSMERSNRYKLEIQEHEMRLCRRGECEIQEFPGGGRQDMNNGEWVFRSKEGIDTRMSAPVDGRFTLAWKANDWTNSDNPELFHCKRKD